MTRSCPLVLGGVAALVAAATVHTGSAAQVPPPATAPVIVVPAAAPPMQEVAATPPTATLATETPGAETPTTATPVAAAATPADPALAAQIECVAKVILHEAANQPEAGRIAVAQVIRTRVKARRWGADACTVIGQPGQFFNVARYNPARGAAWAKATAIAARTLAGEGEELVAGALFFRGAASRMPGHVRVAQIADHVFYR